jgi:tRNA (guanine9-N1)-methyltransferase
MSESYEHLWRDQTPSPTPGEVPATNAVEGGDTAPAPMVNAEIPAPSNTSPRISQNTIVYLTADTEDELTELRPDETYIIGGICDHNRYKVRINSTSF